MPQISAEEPLVTQITVVDVDPGHQAEALELMTERARFMAAQPGFISISLHRSLDGNRIVNYVQWVSKDALQAAHRMPEFRTRWPELTRLSEDAVPNLYEIAHIEAAPDAA